MNPFGTPDPVTQPVSFAIGKLRDEIKPILLAATKTAMEKELGPAAAMFGLLMDDATIAKSLEETALHCGVLAYLELEGARRLRWEASVEKRLQEVRHDAGFDREPSPVTERNT